MLVGKCSTCDRYVEVEDTDGFCPRCGATGFYTDVQDITAEEYRELLKPRREKASPKDDFDYDAGSELLDDLGPGSTLNWLQYNVLVQLAFVGLTGLSTCTGAFQRAEPPFPFPLIASVMFVSLVVSLGISVTAPRRDSGLWDVARTLVVVIFTAAQPVTFFVLLWSAIIPTPKSVTWPLAILWLVPWLLIVFGKPWRRIDVLSPDRTDARSVATRRLLVSVVALALLALGASTLASTLSSAGPLDWRPLLVTLLPVPFALAVLGMQLASLPIGATQPGPARRILGRVSLWTMRVFAIPLVGWLLLQVPALILGGQHVWSRYVFHEAVSDMGLPFTAVLLVLGAALVVFVASASVGTWKSSFDRTPEEVPGLAGVILDIFFRDWK